ncbi:MAG: STAS/SEC14 domain-containing protein [Myxococcales bacterium]|nr:STAS/SEC14 domain-containing protein [Myxococcales bacterium]
MASPSKHIQRREDDLIVFEADGVIEEADVEATLQISADILRTHPQYWILVDLRKLTGVEATARRRAATSPQNKQLAGVAAFGASTLMRSLITLIVRAMVMLGHSQLVMRFFETEAEARAWLAEQRTPPTPATR